VTTVGGNVPVANATENSLRVLEYIGRASIPVYAGAAEPLARPARPGAPGHRNAVETRGELTVGRTIIDTHHRSGREPAVWVALDADAQKFRDLLLATFAAR
jgi:inosine-uridine nucleoside N-ribohydrolase